MVDLENMLESTNPFMNRLSRYLLGRAPNQLVLYTRGHQTLWKE
jgi:hypothetical protein